MKLFLAARKSRPAIALRSGLEGRGHRVDHVDSAEDALAYATSGIHEASLVDASLALADANVSLITAMRREKVQFPVMALSGEPSKQLLLKAFREGADDFLGVPCDEDELDARLHVLGRRSRGHATNLMTVGDLVLDVSARIWSLSGVVLAFTRREHDILEYIAAKNPKVVTYAALMDHIYGFSDSRPEDAANVMKVHVSNIRGKLARAGSSLGIGGVWGQGFRLQPGSVAATAGRMSRVKKAPERQAA